MSELLRVMEMFSIMSGGGDATLFISFKALHTKLVTFDIFYFYTSKADLKSEKQNTRINISLLFGKK